jgi:xanthine dehydrogenase accessory factor
MNEIEFLIQNICEQLERGSPLVLISLLSQQGSTPRHSSTKMVVSADNKSYGTIGGSLIEATAVVESTNVLSLARSKILSFELNGKDATSAGMICGGKAEVLMDYIPATNKNLEFFWNWRDSFKGGDEFYFLTHLRDSANSVEIIGHSILYPDGRLVGDNSISQTDMSLIREELHNISTTTVIPIQDTRVMIDPIRKLKTMYCFGAGHIAVPTAHLAALVGFRVVIIDDRAEFANSVRFPDAHKIRVIDSFNRAFENLKIDSDSFIVIVTRGHQYDRAVLEQALKTDAGYIGMISSRRKRDAIYEYLKNHGVHIEKLEKIHSPIGIDIDAETPAEIAVSIVGELIKERNKQRV